MKLLQKDTHLSDSSQKETESLLSDYFFNYGRLRSILPDQTKDLEKKVIDYSLKDIHADDKFSFTDKSDVLSVRSPEQIEDIIYYYELLDAEMQRAFSIEDKVDVLKRLVIGFSNRSITTGDREQDMLYLEHILMTTEMLNGHDYETESIVDFSRVTIAADSAKTVADSYLHKHKNDLKEREIRELKELSKAFAKIKRKARAIDSGKELNSDKVYEGRLRLDLIAESLFEGEYTMQEREPSLIERVQTGFVRMILENAYKNIPIQRAGYFTPQDATDVTLNALTSGKTTYNPLKLTGVVADYIDTIAFVPREKWEGFSMNLSGISMTISAILKSNSPTFEEMKQKIVDENELNRSYFASSPKVSYAPVINRVCDNYK